MKQMNFCKLGQILSFGKLMIMETAGFKLSFKQLGLGLGAFFLLFSLQLHLALAQNSMVADLNQEKYIGTREPIVPKKLSLLVKLGGKHEIEAVGRRGGGGGARGAGGEHSNTGAAAGDNGSGGTKSPDGQAGAVIPVYAAGAMNHNRYHHHGSNSGTTNCTASGCFALILFASFFFVYST
ncbi:uncharacterized protein LOC111286424 [Durio zibethinus]|uniref:Uncharacterized protein LOC111286424 n=1 Tax=Durio zibethinus TaxID=66656 RepID=A0A6P5XW88_DURZI|nr:uncharacterized protein LOC111286424 [Durio zibethinus]